MKNLLLTLSLIAFSFMTISAQKQYTYLKGQTSPFNGEYNEPRIKGVDSISYIYYENEWYVDYIIDEERPPYEEIPGLFPASVDYFLIKNSSDRLSDTLRYYEEFNGETAKFVKKYSDDGKYQNRNRSSGTNHRGYPEILLFQRRRGHCD